MVWKFCSEAEGPCGHDFTRFKVLGIIISTEEAMELWRTLGLMLKGKVAAGRNVGGPSLCWPGLESQE